jgi:hypothetical protein
MHRIRSGKVATPTKHLEKARGMKRLANRLLRREGHEATREALSSKMLKYDIKEASDQFDELIKLIGQGEEVVLTENGIDIAKVVPPTQDDIACFEKTIQERN